MAFSFAISRDLDRRRERDRALFAHNGFQAVSSANMSLELVAVLTGIASVLFSINRHIFVYPVGLISVLIYVYLCFKAGIYADMAINIFFAVLSISGWIAWQRGADKNNKIEIKVLSTKSRAIYLILTLLLWLAIVGILKSVTDSQVPILDGLVTAVSITGMILMNSRAIEHWYCWLIVNAFSIPLFWTKGLPLTSVQFALLFVMAGYGLFDWQKQTKISLNT